MRLPILFASLIYLILTSARVAWSAATPSPGAWTIHDLELVATDAESAIGVDQRGGGLQRLTLADSLINAGDKARARQIMLNIAATVGPPPDLGVADGGRVALIQLFARLGDLDQARTLAEVEAPPRAKAALLGKLGVAYAESGQLNRAAAVAAQITALAVRAGPTLSVEPSPPNTIRFEDNLPSLWRYTTMQEAASATIEPIAEALEAKGDHSLATTLIAPFHAGPPKVRFLSIVANDLCNGGDRNQGRLIARQAADMAIEVAPQLHDPQIGSKLLGRNNRGDVIAAGIEGLIACDEQAAAETLIEHLPNDIRNYALDRVAKTAVATGQQERALLICGSNDDSDPVSLIASAKRRLILGDRSGAARDASVAARLPAPGDDIMLPGDLLSLLRELGLYDTALAYGDQSDAQGVKAGWLLVLESAANHRDTTAVERLVPQTILVFNKPLSGPPSSAPDPRSASYFFEAARALYKAGYPDQASKLAVAMNAAIARPGPFGSQAIEPWRIAVLVADCGDVDAAIKDARLAGPMSVTVPMQRVDPAAPADHQLHLQQYNASIAGPAALALVNIITDMTVIGRVEDAQHVVALFGPDDKMRDISLVRIAEAQLQRGDLRGALATTLGITDQSERVPILLKLAKQKPRD